MKILIDSVDSVDESFDEKFFHSIADKIADYVSFNPQSEISLVLIDDQAIKEVNAQYRGKDTATDVLSFPMEEDIMLGDIAISMETAARQAEDAGITIAREVAFLFIHGFLHLLGYDHEGSEEEAEEMFDLQELILREWEKHV